MKKNIVITLICTFLEFRRFTFQDKESISEQ